MGFSLQKIDIEHLLEMLLESCHSFSLNQLFLFLFFFFSFFLFSFSFSFSFFFLFFSFFFVEGLNQLTLGGWGESLFYTNLFFLFCRGWTYKIYRLDIYNRCINSLFLLLNAAANSNQLRY